MNVQIYVAAHKPYRMPVSKTYQPIFVGAAVNGGVPLNYQPDNTGDNISTKNPNYNELTAIYWIWKNCHADVKGIVQYRRYLSNNPKQRLAGILDKNEINRLLNERDVIVPRKRHYYIETNYSHYIHAHHQEPLDTMRKVVRKTQPDYLSDYDVVMHRTSAHMFNMMIMPADKFDAYAEWLFSILFKVEAAVDISHYDSREARVFGYLSELLLDVWLRHNQLSFAEVPVMYMEKQQLPAKAYNLLKRKFFPQATKRTHF
ncbi:DUF4422 domain-containing protein [Lactiplantibacillus garii]|uniref:DUF4422 domain-containing protein n=1 Tax=Lactiplantibacillus garii TaxID=2306423 RepID=A0A3R8KGP1_9LACO|nr:DUF4422 domain-containing protein [Lactiplantibacillus garii]RRK09478.1 DUF4422 domain-containing protein [Lactiplantibacillus garii]